MIATKRRALINVRTSLENVPKEWLNQIEPKIFRGAFLPCWVWSGALDNNGYPIMNVDGRQMSVAKMVAKIFYEFPEDWHVDRSCHNKSCLNPNHIRVRKFHPNHYSD